MSKILNVKIISGIFFYFWISFNNNNNIIIMISFFILNFKCFLNLYVDVIWPWCVIGVRNLQSASTATKIPVNITWEPFFLNKTTPEDGEDLKEHIIGKYGPGAAKEFGILL